MTRRTLAALAVVALMGAGCGGGSDEPGSTGATTGTGTATATATKKKATAREKGVEFAGCMREHGVREFPDPDASGELTLDGAVNGSSLDPDGPAWKAAIRACKDLQPAGFTGHKRNAQEQEGAMEFARCIRDNGVKDFPDPVAGDPLVDTNKIPSANAPGGMAILNAAMQTCSDAAARAGVSR
jgi:hypothetical protein